MRPLLRAARMRRRAVAGAVSCEALARWPGGGLTGCLFVCLFVFCLFVCLRCSKQSLGYFAHADDELRRPFAAKLPPLASASKAPCAPQAESPSRGWLQPTVPAAVMPVSAEACTEDVPGDGADCERQTRVLEPDIALPDFGLDRGAQPRGARTHGARSVLAALEPHGLARVGLGRLGWQGDGRQTGPVPPDWPLPT